MLQVAHFNPEGKPKSTKLEINNSFLVAYFVKSGSGTLSKI
jgi:hypothetical protein